jgi:hypothetical protein
MVKLTNRGREGKGVENDWLFGIFDEMFTVLLLLSKL